MSEDNKVNILSKKPNHLSKDAIAKRTETRRKNGWFKNPEEFVRKRSNSMKGKNYMTDAIRKKISDSNMGRKIPKEILDKRNVLRAKKYEEDVMKYQSMINVLKNDEIINGVLLSDGGIHKPNTVNSNACLNVAQIPERGEFLTFIEKHIQDLGFNTHIHSSLQTGSKTFISRLSSSAHVSWTELRKYWYPEGKKIIPSDLKLTPKTIAWWFMGDGTCFWGDKEKTRSRIQLATQCFTFDEVLIVKRKLLDLGITHIAINHEYDKPDMPIIDISTQINVKKFLEIVEPFILPAFRYKIKIPTNDRDNYKHTKIKIDEYDKIRNFYYAEHKSLLTIAKMYKVSTYVVMCIIHPDYKEAYYERKRRINRERKIKNVL